MARISRPHSVYKEGEIMITINDSIELLTASINEAYKENGGVWDKVLILRFPKADFSFEQARELATEAETVTNVTKDKIYVYKVTDIVDTKTNIYYTDIWVNNPDVVITDNLAEKLEDAENALAQAATEEQINEAIAEGVNSIDN